MRVLPSMFPSAATVPSAGLLTVPWIVRAPGFRDRVKKSLKDW
jgi:hypothetical protein